MSGEREVRAPVAAASTTSLPGTSCQTLYHGGAELLSSHALVHAFMALRSHPLTLRPATRCECEEWEDSGPEGRTAPPDAETRAVILCPFCSHLLSSPLTLLSYRRVEDERPLSCVCKHRINHLSGTGRRNGAAAASPVAGRCG